MLIMSMVKLVDIYILRRFILKAYPITIHEISLKCKKQKKTLNNKYFLTKETACIAWFMRIGNDYM